MPNTRWTLTVSRDTDDALRRVLGAQGRGRGAALSRFVEDAVRARLLEFDVARAKARNAHRSEAEIAEAVDEALDWARGRSRA